MLQLSRMEIEEAGPSPERIAAAVHAQLSHTSGAVPVEAITAALDIVQIRTTRTQSFVGALVMGPDRSEGAIAVSEGLSRQRRRFTIAHELGHFLNLRHRPIGGADRFVCSRRDLAGGWKAQPGAHRHWVQEAEANRFAIELLAPRRLVAPCLRGLPDLARVVGLAGELDLSKEAGARRYCELLGEPAALVFSREGLVRYVWRGPEFPFVRLLEEDLQPDLPQAADASGLSAHEETDAWDWLGHGEARGLVVQTLHQQGGYAITLLAIDQDTRADEGD